MINMVGGYRPFHYCANIYLVSPQNEISSMWMDRIMKPKLFTFTGNPKLASYSMLKK